MSKVGFFFYPGDWLKDTRVLTLEHRGCWIDLLCVLYENDGEITWSLDEIARFVTLSCAACDAFVTALSRLRVADVRYESRDKITIVSRRMKRDVTRRQDNALRKQKQRDRMKKHRESRNGHAASHPSLLNPSLNPSLNSLKIKNQKPPSAEPSAEPSKKKLNPAIKAAADPIFNSDPKKYEKLVAWIKAAEAGHYSAAVIIAALVAFQPYAASVGDRWWGYLDKMIDKEEAKQNGRNAAIESEKRKREDDETAQALLRRYGLGEKAH